MSSKIAAKNNSDIELYIVAATFMSLLLFLPLAIFLFIDQSTATQNPLAGIGPASHLNLDDFKPEPAERLTFLAGLVTVPLLMLLLLSNSKFSILVTRAKSLVTFLSLTILLAILPLTAWLAAPSTTFIEDGIGFISFYHSLLLSELIGTPTLVIVLVATIIAAAFTLPTKGAALGTTINIASWTLIVLCSAMSVFGENDIMAVSVHFQVFANPIVNVFHGGTLLVNTSSQYGFYPHFVLPFFKLMGLSVQSISLLFSALTLVSLGLLWTAISRLVSNPVVAFVGFLTLLSCSFLYGRYMQLAQVPTIDPYFQYWPIRSLFPALAIYLITTYNGAASKVLYFAGHSLLAAGILWNLDSGIPAWAAWIAFLMYREEQLSHAMRHLTVGVAILCAVSLLFFSYLFVRSGTLPNISAFFQYQEIFFYYGFYMLPMPLLHPWNLLLLVYAVAICYALYLWLNTVWYRKHIEQTQNSSIIFALAILGCGLFSYYLGRSHDFVFPTVSYAAILLLTIFLDSFILSEPGNASLTSKCIALYTVLFMTLFTASLLARVPIVAELSLRRLALISANEYPRTTDIRDLIQKNNGSIATTIILSNDATFWHLTSGTYSPVSDNFNSILYESELDKLIEAISSKQTKHIYVDRYFTMGSTGSELAARDRLVAAVSRSGYRVIDQSLDGTFQVWQ